MPPLWPEPGFAAPADLAACRALLRGGSRSFFAASLLLPQRVRGPAGALYAFCRLADDAIDLDEARSDALARLHVRLDRAYAGRPLPAPVDRAFADVVARYAVPRALPEALFEGFAWDAAGRRYQDLPALRAYAARVAGTVGAMMAVLMGVRAPDPVARACDLGIAMQLSNIARDVGEDARAGRLYLPLAWLREAGIDPDAWLARPRFTVALGDVIRQLLDAADHLYARAGQGIDRLPRDCRPGIQAARFLYAGIGHEVARRGFDSVTRRAVVPGRRKATLLARAMLAAVRTTPVEIAMPLDEARFLIEAVGAAPVAMDPGHAEPAWWDLDNRVGRVIDLFHKLERRRAVASKGLRAELSAEGG